MDLVSQTPRGPDLPFPLAFLEFLAFFLSKDFLAFFSVFPFFPQGGLLRIRNPCFFGGFPCRFPEKQGKEDQGVDPCLLKKKSPSWRPTISNRPSKPNQRKADPRAGSRKRGIFARIRNVAPGQKQGPPTLVFGDEARVFSQKSKGFSLRGTPKILGKERINAPRKQGKSEDARSKEIEKSKDWRVRASK